MTTKSNKCNEEGDNEVPNTRKDSENDLEAEEKGDEEEHNPSDSNC